jgi:glutamate-1-semialdehyde 2,1-aminomutase
VKALLAAYAEVLPLLRTALEQKKLAESLRGAPVEAVFRRTTNFNVKPKPAVAPATPGKDDNGART